MYAVYGLRARKQAGPVSSQLKPTARGHGLLDDGEDVVKGAAPVARTAIYFIGAGLFHWGRPIEGVGALVVNACERPQYRGPNVGGHQTLPRIAVVLDLRRWERPNRLECCSGRQPWTSGTRN
jgi:hypothetical protein